MTEENEEEKKKTANLRIVVNSKGSEALAEELAKQRREKEAKEAFQDDEPTLNDLIVQTTKNFPSRADLWLQATSKPMLKAMFEDFINEQAEKSNPNKEHAGSAPLNSAQFGEKPNDLFTRKFENREEMVKELFRLKHEGSKETSAYKKQVCSTCGKELPEGYMKKTCALCLEKAKARHTVKRVNKELERESQKFLKKLQTQGIVLPKIFGSFSVYQEYWRTQDIEKSWEDFVKDREEAIRNQVRARADNEADKIHRSHRNNKRFLSKFLRPDLYPFSKEEACRQFRFQKLGLFPEQEPFLTDHIELDLCEGCKEWLYQIEHSNFDNYLLQSEPDEEGNYFVAFIILKSENPTKEDIDILNHYLGDSAILKLYDKKRGKQNIFCYPDKIKEIPHARGCIGTAWGRPHEEPEGDNLFGKDESWKS